MIANQSTSLQQELLKKLTRIADTLERAYPAEQGQRLDPDIIAFQWQYRLTQGGKKSSFASCSESRAD